MIFVDHPTASHNVDMQCPTYLSDIDLDSVARSHFESFSTDVPTHVRFTTAIKDLYRNTEIIESEGAVFRLVVYCRDETFIQ
jgi:hypothetical protein